MTVSILTDNRVKRRGLLAEHGLSLFIETDGRRILFDTGQSSVYLHNAAEMGVAIDAIDAIVLSHGHYDHCGGLAHFPSNARMPPVYVHPSAFRRRFAAGAPEGRPREIGIPWALESHPRIAESISRVQGHTEIFPGIHLVSGIPSVAEFEGVPEGFLIEQNGVLSKDLLFDEQLLVCETGKGLAIFLGCSHPGVINCLKSVRRLFPAAHVSLLMGGMHLDAASPIRLDSTIQSLLDPDIEKVLPLHCTGSNAMDEMKRHMGVRCETLCAGDRFIF